MTEGILTGVESYGLTAETRIQRCVSRGMKENRASLSLVVSPWFWEITLQQMLHTNRPLTVTPLPDGLTACIALFICGHRVEIHCSKEIGDFDEIRWLT